LGELYFEWGSKSEALLHYRHALQLTPSAIEQQLLQQKINSCSEAEDTNRWN
jgi:predicted negative regulator of RcsB-dependent stress response